MSERSRVDRETVMASYQYLVTVSAECIEDADAIMDELLVQRNDAVFFADDDGLPYAAEYKIEYELVGGDGWERE